MAEKDLVKHFELRSWGWQPSFFRGLPRLFLGKLDLALADFNLAASYRVQHPWIFYFRGETYRQMKQCDKAIDDYGVAIKLNIGQPDTRPYEGRAACNTESGRYSEAMTDLETVKRIDPSRVSVVDKLITQIKQKM